MHGSAEVAEAPEWTVIPPQARGAFFIRTNESIIIHLTLMIWKSGYPNHLSKLYEVILKEGFGRAFVPLSPTTLNHPSLHVVSFKGSQRLRALTLGVLQKFEQLKEISLEDTRPLFCRDPT